MDEYISKEQAVAFAAEAHGCRYRIVSGKQILFEAEKDGKRFCMCTPKSKYHAQQGCYWVDITSKQYELLDGYDKAFLFFRLGGMKIAAIRWEELKQCMTPDAMTSNANEGDHWKLRIYGDYLTIGRNANSVPIEVQRL